MFAIFLINLMIKQKSQNSIQKFVRVYINIALSFASLYSLGGAIVHQLFVNDDQDLLYNLIWDFGQMFGFIAFVAFGAASFQIYKPFSCKYITLGYIIVTSICIIINWTLPLYALDLCMAILFIDVIIFVTFSSLRLKREIKVHNIFYIKIFTTQMISILIIFIGAICQVAHVSSLPEFDYNAIYHCCNIISIPVLFETVYWGINFDDQCCGYEKVQDKHSE